MHVLDLSSLPATFAVISTGTLLRGIAGLTLYLIDNMSMQGFSSSRQGKSAALIASCCDAMTRTHIIMLSLVITVDCFHAMTSCHCEWRKMNADNVVRLLTPALCLFCSRHCRTCISPYSSTRSASLMSRARCGWSSMRALSQLLSDTTGSLPAGPTLSSRRASELVSSCSVAATKVSLLALHACAQ